MHARLRPRLNHATVVAYLALFVALGGSGYAAVKINGKNLKDRSVAGKKLKSDSVAGAEVAESKLAKVPQAKLADAASVATRAGAADSATTAATATNATNLGGRPASAYVPAGCPDELVEVGSVCVDRYEASIWTAPSGGTQITGAIPCAANGQDCKGKIFARSVAGVAPRAVITWFQAQQALVNSGKRLPTNAEWQAAVAGTPDSTACNVSTGSVANTGASAGCVSDWGANDMVGNLSEWVADWVPDSTTCPGWGAFSDDSMCLSGASTSTQGPGAVFRGGNFGSGAAAGPFAVLASFQPSEPSGVIGFRGAR